MIALTEYLADLRLHDECRVHGKEYMYKFKLVDKATRGLLEQDYVYYCIGCLYEDDQEDRALQKATVHIVSPGIK